MELIKDIGDITYMPEIIPQLRKKFEINFLQCLAAGIMAREERR